MPVKVVKTTLIPTRLPLNTEHSYLYTGFANCLLDLKYLTGFGFIPSYQMHHSLSLSYVSEIMKSNP